MLEDRPYMRDPMYGAHRSVTMIMVVLLAACFILQSVLISYSSDGAFLLYRDFALSKAAVMKGYVWQLLTFQFIHAGFLHVFFNCLALFFLGRALEPALQRKHWLGIYLGAGVAGGLLHATGNIFLPNHFPSPVVGASAGVCGLLAAFSYLYPQQEIYLWFVLRLPARFFFIISVILSAFFILVPAGGHDLGYAHGAHLGGLLFGYAYARWLIHYDWRLPSLRLFRRPKVFVHTRRASNWQQVKQVKTELPSDEFISREVDPILDKISAHGIQSLTDRERKILEAARAKMARR
ncbi:MAG TPA: rhomboid family intramembrane serine protease [Verrucomicrobiae bacterium]|nr:rhomboid family intramembrane serine protease [Verrucomicrobiae bacterium]